METYSSSPHLFVDLDIPEGSKGRLKTAGPPRVREPQAASSSRDGARDSGRGGQRSGGDRGGQRPPRAAQTGGAQHTAAAQTGTAQSGTAPAATPATDGGSRPPRRRNRTRRPSTPAAE